MITVDGFTDIELVGRGGLGDVYRALRTSTGATVALKVLREVDDASIAWSRTRRELAALVALEGHRNVVQLYELVEVDGVPVLVMEFAPGGSVADLVERRARALATEHQRLGPLSLAETLLVGRHTSDALVAAHELGIVHRDVKPQNLLIDRFGQIKLCDFGIASLTRSDEFRARTTAVSLRYASPEELDGCTEPTSATDVYSLGATLLHLHRGAPPTLRDRLTGWPRPVGAEGHADELDRIIEGCLAIDPVDRPTAADVADALSRLGDETGDRRPAVRCIETAATSRPPVDDLGTDDTVRRDDAPAIVARSRWLSRALVAAAVIVVAAVGFVATTVRLGQPALAVADRPAGLSELAQLAWSTGPVGECLVQTADAVHPVACDDPHDLQRIESSQLDDSHDDVRGQVSSACAHALESFVGSSVEADAFDVAFTVPSPALLAVGDRSYQCFAGVVGRRLVGDARGPTQR